MKAGRALGRLGWPGRLGLLAGAAALLLGLGLPRLLAGLGLHPDCPPFEGRLQGRRALIVTTSHAELGPAGQGGKPTGVAASEMTAPYYEFTGAGMTVDIASISGGAVPVDPQTLLWFIRSHYDDRYLADTEFRSKVAASLAVADAEFADYDIVYLAGGWGAAFDLASSEALAHGMSAAHRAGRVIGGVCHGPLGLLGAHAADGSPLVSGRRLTAVTDKQVRELGIESTPQHPERELRAAGALFESETRFRDIFADHVVRDGRLISGQNQNSGCRTAQEMMRAALEAG